MLACWVTVKRYRCFMYACMIIMWPGDLDAGGQSHSHPGVRRVERRHERPGAAFASWRRAKALVTVRSNRTEHLQLRAGHLKVRHTAEMDEMWFEKRMNLGHKSSRIVLALWQNSVSRVRSRMLCVQQLALLCTCGGAGDKAIRWMWQVNYIYIYIYIRAFLALASDACAPGSWDQSVVAPWFLSSCSLLRREKPQRF